MCSRFKCAGGHELSDQHNALPAFGRPLPGVVEAHDVGMLQALQHAGLLLEALPLRLGQLAILRRQNNKSVSSQRRDDIFKHLFNELVY